MNVDRSVEGFEIFAFDEIHQPFAVEHPARVAGEGDEQIELIARQYPLLAVDADHPRPAVDLEPTEA